MERFDTPDEFLRNLRTARLCHTSKTPYFVPGLTVAMIPFLAGWRRMRQLFGRP
jgi:hypothetical protein